MICNKVDYALAQKLAYETVQRSQQKKLPLSIKRIIRSFPNLHLQKYTTFAKRHNLSLEDVYERIESEDGCLWMKNSKTYIILYNDTIENSGRIRFTLAHELGHYLLKHNEKSKKTIMSRYSLSDDEYDVFEKEANYFAKRLLAPIPLVDLYVANWNKIVASSIEYAFDTSYTVANFIINDLNKRYRNSSIIREGHPMVDNFIDFINKDAQSKICTNCNSLHQSNISFCSYCGEENFVHSKQNYVNYNIERSKVMIYSKIDLNEYSRAKICPLCQNESLSEQQNACQICGTNIMNRCLGEIDTTEWGSSQINTITYSGGCPEGIKGIPGDARFCPCCGGDTTYSFQNLLTDWRIEKEALEQKEITNVDSFVELFLKDKDLPF